jgi:hypothetical protein
MGKWIATVSYRGSSDCSVAPETLIYEFTSDPNITRQSSDICGSNRYSFSATATKMTRADGSIISQGVAGILCSTSSLYHSVSVQYIPDSIKYDCLNGECVNSTQYSTPGTYDSLASCQANCGGTTCGTGRLCVDPNSFCPDGKVCLDQGEFSSIEALISKIGSKVC